MNKLMIALIITVLGVSVSNKSFADQGSKIRVPVSHVYVPKGFDENDNIEVVVTGVLPNLCYYGPSVDVEVKNQKISLNVTAYHRNVENKVLCPLVVVPFTLTARVGVLPQGDFKILANGGATAEQSAKLKVAKSTSNLVDEHIYANVEGISRTPGTNTVNLSGYNPSDCYELDRVQVISNNKDTLSVLPIMKQVRDFCPMKMMPFSIQYEVPEFANKSNFLIHVRSMKGASANYLYIQEE